MHNFASNLMCSYYTLQFLGYCSGNDVFSHITATFVNMSFNKDHVLIESLCLLKVYTAPTLVTEVPRKSWNEQKLCRLLK